MDNPQITQDELVRSTRQFIDEEAKQKKNAFQVSYSLILGHHANEHEARLVELAAVLEVSGAKD